MSDRKVSGEVMPMTILLWRCSSESVANAANGRMGKQHAAQLHLLYNLRLLNQRTNYELALQKCCHRVFFIFSLRAHPGAQQISSTNRIENILQFPIATGATDQDFCTPANSKTGDEVEMLKAALITSTYSQVWECEAIANRLGTSKAKLDTTAQIRAQSTYRLADVFVRVSPPRHCPSMIHVIGLDSGAQGKMKRSRQIAGFLLSAWLTAQSASHIEELFLQVFCDRLPDESVCLEDKSFPLWLGRSGNWLQK
eukprot:1025893-Prorocentrum_minimum.AAC.1